ncbi:MAG: L,D-transpeptidase [Albidovulum sp.]
MIWLGRVFRATIVLIVLMLGALALFQHRFEVPPPIPGPPLTGEIDRILVEKSARRLTVFRNGEPLRSYQVALGFQPEGDKIRQGDGKTPEGNFRINRLNAGSAFHLSLGLDYPQHDDILRARAGGYSPGGDIFIHGQPNALFGKATLRHDWTEGCIALSDAEIEEIWRITPIGTAIEIRP